MVCSAIHILFHNERGVINPGFMVFQKRAGEKTLRRIRKVSKEIAEENKEIKEEWK